MSESPSSPEDGLEDALRRALSDAVSGVEPGADGLDNIRARIGRRPPRSLADVASSRAPPSGCRFWTWRGHWAWPGLPQARARLSWRTRRPRHRKGVPAEDPRRKGDAFPGRQHLTGGASACCGWRERSPGSRSWPASRSSVQPFRQAIIQASDHLRGGTAPQRGRGAAPTRTGRGPPPRATPWQRAAPRRRSGRVRSPARRTDRAASNQARRRPERACRGVKQPGEAAAGATDSGSARRLPALPRRRRTPLPGPADPARQTRYRAPLAPPPRTPGTTETPGPTATAAWTCAVTPGPGTSTPTATPELHRRDRDADRHARADRHADHHRREHGPDEHGPDGHGPDEHGVSGSPGQPGAGRPGRFARHAGRARAMALVRQGAARPALTWPAWSRSGPSRARRCSSCRPAP